MADKTLTAVAVVGGVAAVGVGAWFLMKKPPGVSPEDVVEANVNFDYLGEGGSYVVLVRFGYHRIASWFDPEEGLDRFMQSVNPSEPDHYEIAIDCLIPVGTPARTYDAEVSILTPSMEPGQDWIIRAFIDKAITVREE